MSESSRLTRRPLRAALGWAVLVCCIAPWGCGKKEPPYQGKSAAELEAMLADPNPTVQVQGAFGLSRLGAEASPAVPALARALSSHDALVRQNAALALGEVGPDAREAVTALTEVLRDEQWSVRRQAALALGKIGPAARPAVTALKKLRQDPNRRVREAAGEALDKIQGKAAQKPGSGGTP